MFTLKKLSREGVAAALERAERYRLLNEPWEAASICEDVLAIDPGNRDAVITLLLARTDQFRLQETGAVNAARELLPRLPSAYDRHYYEGIINERRGKALLQQGPPGSGPAVYDLLRQAMECYEKAEPLRPPGNDAAIIRWNTCARLIMSHVHVRPGIEEPAQTMLE
jgi:tetratricopeptide (TPR) repeat protein